MELKQTAGRTALGEFAPKFAQLNDDVLFGEVWSRKDKLSLRDRSIVTVVALAHRDLPTVPRNITLNPQRKTECPKRRLLKFLHTPLFIWAGQRLGRFSEWRKRSGRRKSAMNCRFMQTV